MVIRNLLPSDPWKLNLGDQPGVDAYVIDHNDRPAMLFIVICAELPEVHLAMRPRTACLLRAAVELVRIHLMRIHPDWKGVWTFVRSARMVGLAERFNFKRAGTAKNGDTYLYHSFNRRTPKWSLQQ